MVNLLHEATWSVAPERAPRIEPDIPPSTTPAYSRSIEIEADVGLKRLCQ